jgi:hypothetical protein
MDPGRLSGQGRGNFAGVLDSHDEPVILLASQLEDYSWPAAVADSKRNSLFISPGPHHDHARQSCTGHPQAVDLVQAVGHNPRGCDG